MRLLLIEDDIHLGKALYEGLREDYACDWFRNAEDGELALQQVAYDIIVLDINLPGKTGLALLEGLRKSDNLVPVLILSARDTAAQRVEGLDAGADDYLVKPFDYDELLARLRVLGRRRGQYQHSLLRHRDIELDTAGRSATRAGKPITLSNKEFEILRLLMENAGRCLSREQIEEKIYDWSDEFGSNTVEVHISAIRRKIGKESIRTMRGIGYIMELPQ
ncbi:MAG TPA: DNA-binding response regulator [Alphaproteobacteria bacterium]|nr:DNA-binding response regulator [Alphaproteobacteria bacterium]HAM48118.1 DNA-binding response regulator [Alphaproteobacteria bacterium]HBA44193.1 DNA-binding response regulator [Alphaproteobacteria bacterium]HBC54925.1 DNA-binding response regulator [Alphaproteobacteria bacterium]HBF98140.1 DNA-binding response regulator [Alphaproteobacteria bacterium]